MAHHQGHVKVIVVVQALQVLVSAGAEESGSNEAADVTSRQRCGTRCLPVPQSHEGVLVQVGRPFLAVRGDGGL